MRIAVTYENGEIFEEDMSDEDIDELCKIYEKETGDVVKTGISGQKLNVNQTSPRANSQVNKWNKIEGEGKYEARIVEKDMQNRSSALEWERNNTNRLSREGNTLSHHKRPKPE